MDTTAFVSCLTALNETPGFVRGEMWWLWRLLPSVTTVKWRLLRRVLCCNVQKGGSQKDSTVISRKKRVAWESQHVNDFFEYYYTLATYRYGDITHRIKTRRQRVNDFDFPSHYWCCCWWSDLVLLLLLYKSFATLLTLPRYTRFDRVQGSCEWQPQHRSKSTNKILEKRRKNFGAAADIRPRYIAIFNHGPIQTRTLLVEEGFGTKTTSKAEKTFTACLGSRSVGIISTSPFAHTSAVLRISQATPTIQAPQCGSFGRR